MFPTVAETLGQVCSCGAELCRKQLGLKPRKIYLLHVCWLVRIIFEPRTRMIINRGERQHIESTAYKMVSTPRMPTEYAL